MFYETQISSLWLLVKEKKKKKKKKTRTLWSLKKILIRQSVESDTGKVLSQPFWRKRDMHLGTEILRSLLPEVLHQPAPHPFL